MKPDLWSGFSRKEKRPNGRERARQAAHIAGVLTASGPPDLEELRKVARDTGFLSPEIRKRVWPMLLNVDPDRGVRCEGAIMDHKDVKQVQLDVVRSMTNYGMRTREREEKLPQLSGLINSVLAANPDLHYYQGFNDVCSVTLMVMGDEHRARPVAERLATSYFREAMNQNFDAVQQALKLIMKIIEKRDKKLYKCLLAMEMDPVFAVSWIITWFAHSLRSLDQVERLYDFFIAHHPLMSLYVSASLLCHEKNRLIEAGGDYPAVHGLMQELPSDIPLDKLVIDAYSMFCAAPPSSVISAASLHRERAFTNESMWRMYPYPFQAKDTGGAEGRVIVWKSHHKAKAQNAKAVLSAVVKGGGIACLIIVGQQLVNSGFLSADLADRLFNSVVS